MASGEIRFGGDQSLGGDLVRFSATTQGTRGQPLNSIISLLEFLGSALKHNSDVSTRLAPTWPSRKPRLCEPASRRAIGTSIGRATNPAMRHAQNETVNPIGSLLEKTSATRSPCLSTSSDVADDEGPYWNFVFNK